MKKILKSKKELKNNRGITLVALIITVILMLILAGVAISAVVDGEGLFSKSREATKSYENSAKDENKTISNLMNYIDKYLVKGTLAADLPTIKVSNAGSTTFTLTVDAKNLGNEILKYEIYINGVLEETVDTTEKTITYNVISKSAETSYSCKVKVYDKNGNSFESKEITQNLVYEAIPLGATVFSENKTYNGLTTGTYDNPIIPKGFYPVNENNSTWGTVDGYKYGLIIEDADKNQYVWIPVDGTNITISTSTSGTLYNNLFINTDPNPYSYSATLPTSIINSINANQGYYIARFESGKEGTNTLVSKQNATVWHTDSFSNMKSVAQSKYASNNTNYGAASTLIYGSQWDTALQFIGKYDVGEAGYDTYATDSTGMGNYTGTSGGDTIESTTEPANCGALPAFRQKNIYDMAGNVWEWTMESYTYPEAGRYYERWRI